MVLTFSGRARRLGALLLTATLLGGGALLTASPAQADARTERYIVSTYTDDGADRTLSDLARKGTRPSHRFDGVLDGFSARLTSGQLWALRHDPRVRDVVADQPVSIDSTQDGAPWGLDRIDQRSGITGGYHYTTTGAGVTVFAVDTGIRLSHHDFAGRATSGYDFVDDDSDASDCNGHGTHTAATIAGATYGVAKQADLVALRVLDCKGEGWASSMISALEYVLDQRPSGPAVVNISASSISNQALDQAVANLVKAGISVVVSAGNDDEDACDVSPARTPSAVTVAASTDQDERAWYSNWGSCVDLFAPGSWVESAYDTSDTATDTLSGTSMAAPHVTGAVARYLQAQPKASPATVRAAMIGDATGSTVTDRVGSPDKLLYLRGTTTGPVTKVAATPSDAKRSITLSWSPPYGFGSPAVTGYRVTRSGDSTPVDLPASARSHTFTGLRAGSTYDVSVTPLNVPGAGSVTTRSVPLLALPGTGRVVTPTAGSTSDSVTSITAQWKAPSSGGAAASYAVQVRRSGSTTAKSYTATGSRRSLKITALTNKATYVVRVRAVNAAGAGAWSSWSSKATAR